MFIQANNFVSRFASFVFVSVVYLAVAETTSSTADTLGPHANALPAYHSCSCPSFDEGQTSDECASLAAAYAYALTRLKVARRAADAAYYEWYDCEMRQQKPEAKPVISAEHSVLVKP